MERKTNDDRKRKTAAGQLCDPSDPELCIARLKARNLAILPDGTIPEANMTAQGPGEPYAGGEKIPACQAFELHGNLYIAADGQGVKRFSIRGEKRLWGCAGACSRFSRSEGLSVRALLCMHKPSES